MSTDHFSLLYFLLGIVPTQALTLALSLSFCHFLLSSLSFASLQNHKHYVVPSAHESPSLMLHSGLHYLQFTSDTKTQSPLCTLDYTVEAKNTNSRWPRAENDFTHSILLASIMTVRQHCEAAASESDAKHCDVASDNRTEDG